MAYNFAFNPITIMNQQLFYMFKIYQNISDFIDHEPEHLCMKNSKRQEDLSFNKAHIMYKNAHAIPHQGIAVNNFLLSMVKIELLATYKLY